MRALTLTQPWATLVAIGAKRFETRSWTTSYRGPVAIHAAKGLGSLGGAEGLVALCRTEPFVSVLREYGDQVSVRQGYAAVYRDILPLGAVVAVVDLVEVLDAVEAADALRYGAFDADDVDGSDRAAAIAELAFGDYSPGRYAWALENVRALASPVECGGKLGLWIPPPALYDQIVAADNRQQLLEGRSR